MAIARRLLEHHRSLDEVSTTMRAVLVASAVLAVLAISVWWLCSVDKENNHRITDGIAEQVMALRIFLFNYYSRHKAPPNLADLSPTHGNEIRFSTLQRIPCSLRILGRKGGTGTVFVVECGDPLYARFILAEDGGIIHEEWHSYTGLQFLRRKRSSAPWLTELLAGYESGRTRRERR